MPRSVTRLRDLPHYRISAQELATWLERQSDESWWSVDGDPLLMERVAFPSPGKDIAAVLRHLGKTLLVLDARDRPSATGDTVAADNLDELAIRDRSGDRVFQFCWETGPDLDWLLVEDTESSKLFADTEERE